MSERVPSGLTSRHMPGLWTGTRVSLGPQRGRRASRIALGDARVPSAANKLDNLDSMDGIQNRRTKVAPTSNAACAGAIFWRQIFWQQRGRLSAQ
jgi:hypothetical protein